MNPIGTEGTPLWEAVVAATPTIASAEVLRRVDANSYPRSRSTDPPTSKEAGESMQDEASAQRQAILAYLRQHPAGLCADRLDEALGFRDGRAGKRCPELCEQGLAVLCDGTEKVIGGKRYHIPELRQQTRSKRWGCIVLAVEHLDPSWRLTKGA